MNYFNLLSFRRCSVKKIWKMSCFISLNMVSVSLFSAEGGTPVISMQVVLPNGAAITKEEHATVSVDRSKLPIISHKVNSTSASVGNAAVLDLQAPKAERVNTNKPQITHSAVVQKSGAASLQMIDIGDSAGAKFEHDHPGSKFEGKTRRKGTHKVRDVEIDGPVSLDEYRTGGNVPFYQLVRSFIDKESNDLKLGDPQYWKLIEVKNIWGEIYRFEYGYFVSGFKRANSYLTIKTNGDGDIASISARLSKQPNKKRKGLSTLRKKSSNHLMAQSSVQSTPSLHIDKRAAITAATSEAAALSDEFALTYNEDEWHFRAKRVERMEAPFQVWHVRAEYRSNENRNVRCVVYYDIDAATGTSVKRDIRLGGHTKNRPVFCQKYADHN